MKQRNRHSGHMNAMKARIIKHGEAWKDQRERVYAQLKSKEGVGYGPIVVAVR